MAEEGFQEKTEKATDRKREKSREEGQVAKSIEVPSVFVLLAGVTILYALGALTYEGFVRIMRKSFQFETVPVFDLPYCIGLLRTFTLKATILLLPVCMMVLFVGLLTNFLQVGFVVSGKAIAPKLSNISLIKGFGRLFSVRSVFEMVKSVFKLSIIGVVAYLVIKGEWYRIAQLYDTSVAAILMYMLKVVFKIFIWAILAMVVVAVLDYAFQRWRFEEQIKMTKQEVKDEVKQTEGDPFVKSRIKSLQYQVARRRMMQEVPEADVVVTNPTHLAVAIKYDAVSMEAPRVVAKGAGMVAQRIRDIAHEHDVPVVENKELAQNLYKLVDIGQEIPVTFFKAIAELLAYVYKLKGKSR